MLILSATLTDVDDESGTGTGPPARLVTVNQVAAWNMAQLRRDAGLTQRELGERIGWTNGKVSDAERSWDGKRTVEFTAQDLAEIALALGVPLAALFLPPDRTYWFPDGQGRPREAETLMRLALPDNDDDTPVMEAYRLRWNERMRHYFASDAAFAGLAGKWIGDKTERGMWEKRLRAQQAQLEALARAIGGDLARIADRIAPEEET